MTQSKKNSLTPLWIISMFFSFTEVMAGYAVFNTDGGIQVTLLIFVILFPILIASAFFMVLWYRPEHFYTPKDFDKDEGYLKSMVNSRKRTKLDVDLYLNTEEKDKIEQTYSAIQDLITSMNFIKYKENPSEKGSWIKKLVIKSKNKIGEDEIESAYAEAEEALKLSKKRKADAENRLIEAKLENARLDRKMAMAKATNNILKSIEDIPSVVLKIGSLIIIKNTIEGNISLITKTLTKEELKLIDENPDLLKNPSEIMKQLEITTANNV